MERGKDTEDTKYTDILAILNHRLRTPILANQNTLSLLADGSFGELSEKQQEIVKLLSENSRELDRLVVMLLALYQYKNAEKQLKIEKGDLVQMICQSIDGYAEKAALKSITLEFDLPKTLPLECDFLEIRTLISHLIDNAIKHGKNKVTVYAHAEAETVSLEVMDDGPGIAPEDSQQLFRHCHYLSSKGKYSPSTGVGLCLCAEIAKAHKGSISCQSDLGAGAHFCVTLPKAWS